MVPDDLQQKGEFDDELSTVGWQSERERCEGNYIILARLDISSVNHSLVHFSLAYSIPAPPDPCTAGYNYYNRSTLGGQQP